MDTDIHLKYDKLSVGYFRHLWVHEIISFTFQFLVRLSVALMRTSQSMEFMIQVYLTNFQLLHTRF
jgi:hypothetical protein